MTSPEGHPQHNHIWALLSLTTFIVVYLSAILLGERGIMPFVYAALMILAVLLIEGLLRGELWLFDPQFNHAICNTDTPYRLMIFVGTFLLILESAILVSAAVDPHLEYVVGQFLIQQSCAKGVNCQ
jgi:hypothetical protein